VAQATPAEEGGFESKFSLDALLTRGNTENGEVGMKLETEGVTRFFEKLRGGGSYAYGQSEVDSVESTTAKRWELSGYARRPWQPGETYSFANAKVESDHVADLHFRVTEGLGLGIYLQKADKLEWSAEAGLSWVFEETDDGSENYPAVRLGERFEREWPEGQKVIQTVELLPHVQKPDEFLLNADVELTTVITRELNLRSALEYRFQSDPPEESRSYDLRLVLGVTYKF
jgi:putative salt-induced outer membrane protein YdiY